MGCGIHIRGSRTTLNVYKQSTFYLGLNTTMEPYKPTIPPPIITEITESLKCPTYVLVCLAVTSVAAMIMVSRRYRRETATNLIEKMKLSITYPASMSCTADLAKLMNMIFCMPRSRQYDIPMTRRGHRSESTNLYHGSGAAPPTEGDSSALEFICITSWWTNKSVKCISYSDTSRGSSKFISSTKSSQLFCVERVGRDEKSRYYFCVCCWLLTVLNERTRGLRRPRSAALFCVIIYIHMYDGMYLQTLQTLQTLFYVVVLCCFMKIVFFHSSQFEYPKSCYSISYEYLVDLFCDLIRLRHWHKWSPLSPSHCWKGPASIHQCLN